MMNYDQLLALERALQMAEDAELVAEIEQWNKDNWSAQENQEE